MNTIGQWIVSALAIAITSYLLPGAQVTMIGALVVTVVLALLNTFIKPIIFVLTLPITILTIGLFTLVINALLVMLAASIVPGFAIDGFWTALFFAIILSLINMFFGVSSSQKSKHV